jgi:hypothetical protein
MTHASTDTRCTGCATIIPAHGFQVLVPGIAGGFHSFACAQSCYERHVAEQRAVAGFGLTAGSRRESRRMPPRSTAVR